MSQSGYPLSTHGKRISVSYSMSYGVFENSDWLDFTSPDRHPLPTIAFLLPETMSLILEPATMIIDA